MDDYLQFPDPNTYLVGFICSVKQLSPTNARVTKEYRKQSNASNTTKSKQSIKTIKSSNSRGNMTNNSSNQNLSKLA